jgi:hypothetical protein
MLKLRAIIKIYLFPKDEYPRGDLVTISALGLSTIQQLL